MGVGGGWQASPSPSHYSVGIHGWMLKGGGGATVTSKKSRFSGPTPFNAPSNDVAPLKTIKYKRQKNN
jgi:hypothetical protein